MKVMTQPMPGRVSSVKREPGEGKEQGKKRPRDSMNSISVSRGTTIQEASEAFLRGSEQLASGGGEHHSVRRQGLAADAARVMTINLKQECGVGLAPGQFMAVMTQPMPGRVSSVKREPGEGKEN